MPNAPGAFSAAPSLLGYLFQVRYALLEALRRLPEGGSFCVTIETLDDVVFEADGGAVDVLQTKHRVNACANLTDTSPDLWKTLRIWSEGYADGSIPQHARLFLITTAACSEGTASYYLCPRTRDEKKALERLAATASTATSQANEPGHRAFRALDDVQKSRLIQSAVVLDASPHIDELDKHLRQSVYYVTERRFLDDFLRRLEGWWYARVVKHLKRQDSGRILSEELEAETRRTGSQFKEDNLPIDDEIMRAAVDTTGYLGMVFVEQLNLIGVSQNRIFHAIRNYFRAFEQRSRWIGEDLVFVGELERYEERLVEEWNLLFEQMRDALGQEAAEGLKLSAARDLYKWIETGMHHAIRPAVTEPAIARGTYQMLADDLRVGWHIEFRERLEALLTPAGVGR